MKLSVLFIVLFFTVLLFSTCEKSEDLIEAPVFIQLNEKSKNLVGSANTFGIELFRKLNSSNKTSGENAMISPLSISMALAMTYNGSDGETKKAIENVLNLKGLTVDEININNKQVSDALQNIDSQVEFSIANSIWYRNSFSVLQDFISVNQEFYNTEVNSLNFDDPLAKNTINSWVANHTNNKIEKIIDEILPEDVMYLLNAIYFKGIWKYEFDATKNIDRGFTLSNRTFTQVEMMVQTASLKYLSNEDVRMVELPYGQGNWAMELVMPATDKNIDQLISELTDEGWATWINSLSEPTEITIALPPFKFEFEQELNDVLSSMGMAIAFNPNSADFSKINNDYQLYISKIKHKTFIEVDEKGTEAAAVTSVEVGTTSIGNPKNIVFDKPFLFAIREVSTGIILFIGKVENPVR